jgi:hypothetical protein
MSYREAPATKMLATDCAACGLPLLDALSVELGMGEHCRRRHCGWTKRQGWGNPVAPDLERAAAYLDAAGLIDLFVAGDPRATCNKVVHRLACGLDCNEKHVRAIAALAALGYRRLAEACAPDLLTVRVEAEGGELVVKAEFSEAFNAAMHRVPGARWVPARKARLVPVASKAALWGAIAVAFGHCALVIGQRVGVT